MLYIDGAKLSLSKWLKLVQAGNGGQILPWGQFPTEEMFQNYLRKVEVRPEVEVKSVMRLLLVHTGDSGLLDKTRLDTLRARKGKVRRPSTSTEYERRLIEGTSPWEGNTWVLDLLPHHPKEAIQALEAYTLAHLELLSDGMIHRHYDVMALIRGRYIHYTRPNEIFIDIGPEKFERLICALYEDMGYTVYRTPQSHDRGVDIIAEKQIEGITDQILIQCKCSKHDVSSPTVRDLLGVIADAKAPYGSVVAAMGFTNDARSFAADNPRIQLINGRTLQRMLNKNFGRMWRQRVDSLTRGDWPIVNRRTFTTTRHREGGVAGNSIA
jgi:restriction system protein